MRCSDVASRATDYTEGALAFWERARVRRHLAGCADCRAYIEGLQTTARALRQLAVEPVDPAQQAKALLAFREFHRTRAERPVVEVGPRRRARPLRLALALTALGVAFQVLFARHASPVGWPWARAVALTVAACALVALALRRDLLAAVLSGVAAVGLLSFAGEGALSVGVGVQCVLHELGTAAIPVATLLLLERARLARASLIGVAAAGALAGAAALHVTCPDASSMQHVLVFHVGGVLAAAALAGSMFGRLLGKLSSAT